MTINEGMLTIDEAAAALRLNPRTVWRWVRAGKVRTAPLPGRVIRIPETELSRLRGELPRDPAWPRLGEMIPAFARHFPALTSTDGFFVLRGSDGPRRLAVVFAGNRAQAIRIWQPGGTLTREDVLALTVSFAPRPRHALPLPGELPYALEELPEGKGWILASSDSTAQQYADVLAALA